MIRIGRHRSMWYHTLGSVHCIGCNFRFSFFPLENRSLSVIRRGGNFCLESRSESGVDWKKISTPSFTISTVLDILLAFYALSHAFTRLHAILHHSTCFYIYGTSLARDLTRHCIELQCIICKDGHVDLRSTILYWTRSDANVLDNRCMSSRFTTHVFRTIQDNRSSRFNAFGRINQVSWDVSNHVKCRDVSARECRSLPKECKMTRAKIEGKVRHLISSMQWPGVTILNLPPLNSGNFPVEKRKKGRKKFMQWTQPN